MLIQLKYLTNSDWMRIFSYLEVRDVCNGFRICKTLLMLLSHPSLWSIYHNRLIRQNPHFIFRGKEIANGADFDLFHKLSLAYVCKIRGRPLYYPGAWFMLRKYYVERKAVREACLVGHCDRCGVHGVLPYMRGCYWCGRRWRYLNYNGFTRISDDGHKYVDIPKTRHFFDCIEGSTSVGPLIALFEGYCRKCNAWRIYGNRGQYTTHVSAIMKPWYCFHCWQIHSEYYEKRAYIIHCAQQKVKKSMWM